jgi:hypothetical protein
MLQPATPKDKQVVKTLEKKVSPPSPQKETD